MPDKETNFNHSVKVPRLFKTAAKIVQQAREEGASIKHLIYNQKSHPNVQALLALVGETLKHGSQLDYLIRTSQILITEPRLDAWLARVLITELFWGKKRLAGEAKPIQTILKYEPVLTPILQKLNDTEDSTLLQKVTKPRYVRVNTIVLPMENAINGFRDEGWRFIPNNYKTYNEFIQTINNLEEDQFTLDFHLKDCLLVFPPGTQFYTHPCYKDGSIILQDKASCIPPLLLNPPEGAVVLDMCAAPGMKTTQLAALMNNTGKVYAVERDQRRCESLRHQVETSNATCVEVINRDVLTMNDKEFPDVEYILVDPSCSGSGMLDRLNFVDPSEKCEPSRLEKLAGFQIMILRHALKNFPKVKRVVYSTCSIYPQENEDVIEQVWKHCFKHFKLLNAKVALGGEWNNVGDVSVYPEVGGNCLYARSETDLTNGFFVCVFERMTEEETNDIKARLREMENEGNHVTEVNGENQVDESENIEMREESIKKSQTAGDNCEENVVEEVIVKKRNKKKRSKDNEELYEMEYEGNQVTEVNGENHNEESGNIEISKQSKKKKKRKKSEAVVENFVENIVEEVIVKKRKKKKHSKDNEEMENEDIHVTEGNDESRDNEPESIEVREESSKKRKRKKSETVDDNCKENIVEEVFVKKRKKKKHSKDNEEDPVKKAEKEGMNEVVKTKCKKSKMES